MSKLTKGGFQPRKSLAALAIGTALMMTAPAAISADKINGSVVGQVAVQNGQNLSNVQVVLKHESKGISRTTTTDENGKFSVKGLPIGNYTVTFSKNGFETLQEKKIQVMAGSTAGFNVAMNESGVERIQVTGSSIQVIDFESSTSKISLTSEELALLPVQQDLTSVALLSPASSLAADQDGDYGRGASFNGSSVAENGYFLNGLNITDIRTGLGHVEFPWEAIAQANVVSGGVSAEYGQFIGGVTDLVTKSGDNEFKFGVSVDYVPGSLGSQSPDTWGYNKNPDENGNYPFEDKLITYNQEDSYDSTKYNIYASGAIIEDTLFFYGIFNPQSVTSEYASTSDYFERTESKADFWLAKVDWFINDNHSLGFTALNNEWEKEVTQADYDMDSQSISGEFSEPDSSFSGGNLWSVNYMGNLTDDISLSAVYGVTEQEEGAINPTADINRVWWEDQDGWSKKGGWVGWSRDNMSNDKRTQFRLDLDWELEDHTIRVGYSSEVVEVADNITYSGDGYRYEYYLMTSGWLNWINGERAGAGQAPVEHELGENFLYRREYSRIGTAESGTTAFYIEDSWRVTDEVTLNLGLRNSSFTSETGEGDKYVDMSNQWAPRLGAIWDVNGEGTTKVSANFGRYFMPISPNTSVRMTLGETNQYHSIKFDSVDENYLPVNPETMWVENYGDGTFTQPYQTLVDADLDPMYSDEFALSVSHELDGNWVLGARYIYQNLKSSIEDTNMKYTLDKWSAANPEEAAKLDPNWDTSSDWVGIVINPGSPVHLAYDQNQDGVISDGEGVTWSADYVGLPKAKRTYQALEFTIQGSPFEGAYMNASYTYSKSEGNTEGLVSGTHSQADPGWSGSFDSPEFTDHSYGNTSNDIPHKFKFYGTYEIIDNLYAGAIFLAQEGRARNILGYHPQDVDSCAPEKDITACKDWNRNNFYSNGNPSPRGSGGHGDWIYSLDLSISYAIDLEESGAITLSGKVFNVLDANTATTYNDMSEFNNTIGQMDPNYGNPTSYQAPRSFLFTARYDF
ncbi:TonB-dependent receptor [Colwellia sp. RSH04]|uniref:TonB-dependent receptor n=1 Tax=Colwellia sp. RSH04 TaxID=2305464 RepID=UPI000E5734A1|nr:TonB-dependent receptor [Colwellia sp. RSH04]RHW77615.1 TonB-dependent receptor [Colwellia sp. RSH04]